MFELSCFKRTHTSQSDTGNGETWKKNHITVDSNSDDKGQENVATWLTFDLLTMARKSTFVLVMKMQISSVHSSHLCLKWTFQWIMLIVAISVYCLLFLKKIINHEPRHMLRLFYRDLVPEKRFNTVNLNGGINCVSLGFFSYVKYSMTSHSGGIMSKLKYIK